MKKCLLCEGYLAKAAVTCPFCGTPVGEIGAPARSAQPVPPDAPVLAAARGARGAVPGPTTQHDEAIGFERSPFVVGVIVALMVLLVTVALVWLWE